LLTISSRAGELLIEARRKCRKAPVPCHEPATLKPRQRHGGPDILALLAAHRFETMAHHKQARPAA
jgi:hypothetical protein